jgi:hypothetical protein
MNHEIGIFLLVTVFLGGGAAYLTGRAVALTWRPFLQLLVYTVGLTFAVRFIHYALFGGILLSPEGVAVDFVVLLALASLGNRLTRARQMSTQYSWLYEQSSPLSWRTRAGSGQPD